MALSGFSVSNNKSGGGGSYEPVSEGVHMARLVQLIDLGIQREEYQGMVSERHKVLFTFEIPGETVNIKGEEKPKFLSIELTASLHEKAKMPQFIKALAPGQALDETLDLTTLLGNGALVTVGRTSGGKAKITTISGMIKGQVVPKTDTPLVSFDFDNQDPAIFETLPAFLKDKIRGAVNSSDAPAASSSTELPNIM